MDFANSDGSNEVVDSSTELDETSGVNVGSTEDFDRPIADVAAINDGVTNNDKDIESKLTVVEVNFGRLEAAATDDGRDDARYTPVIVDEILLDVCPMVDTIILDDASPTTEEIATTDLEPPTGTTVDSDSTGGVNSTALDERTEIDGCTAVLVDTVCVDVESSEVVTGLLDDKSCTTEEVASVEKDS